MLLDGFSIKMSPPQVATSARQVRVRSCKAADDSISACWRADGLGIPVGCCNVRTGFGPPGRSLARENAEEGGAAQAALTMPDAAK